MKLQAFHILQLNLSNKDILKVSKITYFTLYKPFHKSVLEILFVVVNSYDFINKKQSLII